MSKKVIDQEISESDFLFPKLLSSFVLSFSFSRFDSDEKLV